MFEEHRTVIITDVTDSNPSLKKAFSLSSNRAGRLQGGRNEMSTITNSVIRLTEYRDEF